MKNYYQILEIANTATLMEIKKAYFSLVKKFSPERFPTEFMAIREAYEVLSNAKTRKEYDLIEELPEAVRADFQAGREHYQSGQLERAIRYLNGIHQKHPELMIVNSLLGEVYLKNGNSGKATKIFEALVAKEPHPASFAAKLAKAYLDRSWHRKAIEEYQRALKLDEDNVAIWSGLIDCHLNNENFEAVYETIQAGLAVSQRNNWDNTKLYFHLLHYDIYQNNLEALDLHLNELKQNAINHRTAEVKNNIVWYLAYNAEQFIQMNGFNKIVFRLVNTALELDPENIQFQKLVEKYQTQITHFKTLFAINQELKLAPALVNLLEFEISVINDSLWARAQLERLSLKFEFIDNIIAARKELLQLKKFSPELFAIKKDFFNDVLNERKEQALKTKIASKLKKFYKMSFFNNDLFELDDLDDAEPCMPYQRTEPKVGRNDPCPCGSGKKYKKCCLNSEA